ncbi:MAG: hypothetical protein CVT77_05660 [Alphaproteobacteria bacterium HGW-Alphaproteobacteria-16]|nr:MAG: hypothetical protein CVT77_05660 [Alphaproteobacteria bacterium HGW-Alphaproteobacteria-16]
MLIGGLLALAPAGYLAIEMVQVRSFAAENILFLMLGTLPAVGGALVIGAIWVFSTTRNKRS